MRIPRELKTLRLLIRPFVKGDQDVFLTLMGDKEATRYLDVPEEQKTPEKLKSLFGEVLTSYTSTNPICALAVIEKASGLYVGSCGLGPRKVERIAWCYYAVTREQWGKGYATEFTRRLLAFAFEDLRIERVDAIVAQPIVRQNESRKR